MKKIRRWLNNRRLQTKLIIIYMVVFLPLIGISCLFIYELWDILTQKDVSGIEAYLYEGVSGMDNQLVVYDNLSNYISYNQSISQVLSYDYNSSYDKYIQLVTALDPLLAGLKYFHSDLKQVTIYLEGETVRHDTTLAPLEEIQGEDWYRNLQEDNRIRWVVSPDQRRAFSVRRMPLMEEYGNTGILYVDVDYDKLFAPFEQTIRHNYGIYITDGEGGVVFSADRFEDRYASYRLDYEGYREELAKAGEGKSRYTVVQKTSDQTGWQVGLYMPRSLVLESITPLIQSAVALVAVCVLAALAAVIITSRLITGRLLLLNQRMKEVEAGNLHANITSQEEDEIGDLIRSFGNMIARIRSLIHEVYEGELRQKAYEMKALQSQINPHFLYNSLSLINWKALEAGKEDISQITLALSTFYRTSLNKGKNMLSIREEINNVRSYLEIQKVMHDDSFDAVYEIEPGILEYETLNLILQPLVENAIEHGLELKEDGRGLLRITGHLDPGEESVVLTVEDNGVGMEQEKAQRVLTEHSEGYGVRNVNERIRLCYGEEYSLRIESAPGKGTRVWIHFPVKKLRQEQGE